MIEDQEEQEEQEPFEEESLFDSEPFVNILYSLAIIFVGIIVVPTLLNSEAYTIVAIKLQKLIIIVGLISFIYNLYYYLLESGYLTPPLPTNEQSKEERWQDRINRDPVNEYSLQSASPDKSSPARSIEYRLQATKKLTEQILQEMDWLRFESLCSAYFSQLGIRNALTGLGADGGIDIKIYDPQTTELTGVVQCKCHSNPISVKLVREFYGVMSSQNIPKGFFITSSSFHQTAIDFARGLNLELISGRDLLHRIGMLPNESQARLFDIATQGDYKTPSCAKCGRKMVERANKETGKSFWACPNIGANQYYK